MKIIRPETISFRASISEDELRRRIADEVLEQVGGLDEHGDRRAGISVAVRRGSRGGYTIEVSGPAPARILLPGGVK